MFKTQNFCHIASNNRNQVKAGVFVYRTTDNLATVSASGYFNARIIDINLHDLIIHEKIDASDATKVERNVLCVTERTLENVGVTVIKSKWEGDIEQEIADLKTYVDNNFVKKDGSSIMSGPLKMRSGSMQCAIAPYWDGVGFFKLNSNDSVTLLASMEATDGLCPAANNTYNLGKTNYKWKDAYIGRVITSVLNNGADISVPTTSGTMALTSNIKNGTLTITQAGQTKGTFSANQSSNTTIDIDAVNVDLSNLSNVGKNISNWSSNVTNCITEIPQDIKLEMSNNMVTLSAGSKLYYPNGTSVVTTSTTHFSGSPTYGKCFVFYTGISLSFNLVNNTFSGSTAPTGLTSGVRYVWLDTSVTPNVIKVTVNAGSTWTTIDDSLPLGIVTTEYAGGSMIVKSIDQVFNGFGYIGSTVFALPGVKYLCPDGKNADGTLNNRISAIQNVITKTIPSNTGWHYLVLNYNGTNGDLASEFYVDTTRPLSPKTYSRYYNPVENVLYTIVSGVYTPGILCVIPVRIEHNSSSPYAITSWNAPAVFHAVDYSDTEYMVHQAMPSDRYIDLTLPISNQSITAPADGYIYLNKIATATSQYVRIGKSGLLQTETIAVASDNWLRVWLPVSKGDVIVVSYNAGGTTNYFRFVYANGAK